MNKVIILGNLTADPEMRATQNGDSVCNFTVAADRRFQKAQDGGKITDFFRIKAWGKLGDSCNQYLAKGKKVGVIGELQARMYKDNNGDMRMSLDVNASEIEFLTPKEKAEQQQAPAAAPSGSGDFLDGFDDINSDDIPF